MGIALRILQLAVAAILIVAVTGLDSMASAAFDEPCCEDERRDQDEPPADCGPDDCSPFCFSCPGRTVTPAHDVVVPVGSVTISIAAPPETELTVPPDPPRRGVFHPPRPSFSTLSR